MAGKILGFGLKSIIVYFEASMGEDRHLLKKEVKEVMEKRGLKIMRLKEAYGEVSGQWVRRQ